MAGNGGYCCFSFAAFKKVMRLSLFDNDETLGALKMGSATFYGWGTASMAFSEGLLVSDFKAASARLGRAVKSVVMRRGSGRDVTFRIVVAMRCSESLGGVEDHVRRALDGTFDAGVTITNSSGSCSPSTQSVGIIPVRIIKPSNTAPPQNEYQSTSDDLPPKEESWLDTLKDLDATTWILIGLAGVLVLKRL